MFLQPPYRESMIEKRGVKIYDFSINEDKNAVEKKFKTLLQMEDLVPVIGSGFTKGIRTKYGTVPSADELKAEMVQIMQIGRAHV